MSYLYETHLHTCESSACGVSPGAEYISVYKDLGYTGIFITDHFYNGNTAVSRNLPWKDWVSYFCEGYELTKAEGDKQGLDVFFGWEETFDNCDDYLIYGLSKEWLWEHPEARKWSRGEQYAKVKAGGGCVVQAHPFRQHSHISRVILSTGCVDAVEAANVGNREQFYDGLAMRYAQKLGLPVTAGSDIHEVHQPYKRGAFGVYLEKKLTSSADFVDAILNKKIIGLKTSPGRCDYNGDGRVEKPLEVRNANDRVVKKSLEELI